MRGRREPGDPELPTVASPTRQHGLGDKCSVQKNMNGLVRLVPSEGTEEAMEVRREGSGEIGKARLPPQAKTPFA